MHGLADAAAGGGKMTERLIIDNRTDISMSEALEYAIAVVKMGRISGGGESYCYVTTFRRGDDDVVVVLKFLHREYGVHLLKPNDERLSGNLGGVRPSDELIYIANSGTLTDRVDTLIHLRRNFPAAWNELGQFVRELEVEDED